MNWPFLIKQSNKGKLMRASTVQDGTIRTYWADGQSVYKEELQAYDPPTRWPIQYSPIVCPKQARIIGARVYPEGVTADQYIQATVYYFRTFVASIEEDLVQVASYYPTSGNESNGIQDLNIYVTGITISGTGALAGNSYSRFVGDGLDPELTENDVVNNPDGWALGVLPTLLSYDDIEYRTDITNPETGITWDVNPDYFANVSGDRIRSQVFGSQIPAWEFASNKYIDSGSLNVRFLNQLSPREEDCEDDYGFFGNKILNIVIVNFVNYGEAFESLTGYTPSDIRGEQFISGLIQRFSQFKSYETQVWLDVSPADLATGFYVDPQRPYDLTDLIENIMQIICDQLSDVGFVYKGRFFSEIDESVQLISDEILGFLED